MRASNSAAQVSTVFKVAWTPAPRRAARTTASPTPHSQASWASENPSLLARRQSRLVSAAGPTGAGQAGPLGDDTRDLVEKPGVDAGCFVQPLHAYAPAQGRLQVEGPVGRGHRGPRTSSSSAQAS